MRPKILGKLGEAMVEYHAWLGLSEEYRLLNNLTLKSSTKSTTQIDHILLSPYGIFVIETKNYAGIIYGKADEKTWKQILGKKTYELYNPIMQNEAHVRVLKGILSGLGVSPHIHNVIVFTTRSRFKRGWFGFGEKLPDFVCHGSAWLSYVRKYKIEVIDEKKIDEVRSKIVEKSLNQGMITSMKHIRNVQNKK